MRSIIIQEHFQFSLTVLYLFLSSDFLNVAYNPLAGSMARWASRHWIELLLLMSLVAKMTQDTTILGLEYSILPQALQHARRRSSPGGIFNSMSDEPQSAQKLGRGGGGGGVVVVASMERG